MVASNDDLVFLDDSEDGTGDAANLQPWRVLVVDDDQDVHEATRFALAHLLILEAAAGVAARALGPRGVGAAAARGGHRRHPARPGDGKR